VLASTKILKWQYNGIAEMSEITTWCKKHFGYDYFGGRWSCVFETIYFDREEDYTMFLLRWA